MTDEERKERRREQVRRSRADDHRRIADWMDSF
jgi:hypothetical protein